MFVNNLLMNMEIISFGKWTKYTKKQPVLCALQQKIDFEKIKIP